MASALKFMGLSANGSDFDLTFAFNEIVGDLLVLSVNIFFQLLGIYSVFLSSHDWLSLIMSF